MHSIPYGKQFIDQSDIDAVTDTLKSNFLTQGPKIAEFEKKFATYVGSKYAVAVSNGTAALHLANLALGVQKGDKIITTPITFAATANASMFMGAEINFVDIDSKTLCIDIDKVEKLLKSKPRGTFKGIVPVDFAGFAVDLERLKKIADEYGLWIIEDACHAPGGYFLDSKKNKQFCGNGNFADMSVFSFHPVKHIAMGEGGMVTTNNQNLYDKLCLFRTHGITKSEDLLEENHGAWYYEMHELGYNYRLTDIQAALGISQLNKAQDALKKRRKIADYYNQSFQNTKVNIANANTNIGNAFHLYVIQIKNRKALYNDLRNKQIYAQVHYIPVHLLPYYKQFGWKLGDMPVAENYYNHCLSLPMFPSLTKQEQNFVIQSILEWIQ